MPSYAAGKELAALGGVFNRFIAAPLTGMQLFNQGRSGSYLDRALRSIPSTSKTDAGRAALNELQYAGGQLLQGRMPYRSVSNLGRNYRDEELALSAAARAAVGPSAGGGLGGGNMASFVPPSSSSTSPRSSSNFPRSGGSTGTFASIASPADRAYAQEVSRTAQLTAQNPEMQRYEAARQADLKSGDFSKSEDIGMEMWARANPTLAAKVKPGQSGYDTIQRVRQEAAQPGAGAFAATTPIFPGAQNFYSGQYQATPGATNPNVGAFTAQQTISSVPQNIGQFPFQATPMQTPGRPVTTQGFGSAPGVDTLGSFTREQLSQDLLNKFAGLQK